MTWERKEENLRNILHEQAIRLWGNERAQELTVILQQLAFSIAAVANYETPLEAEPAFFKTE
ncbi:MAG: hypothetical protein ACPL5I_14810 [Thermodesulfobacteriota bacterium]